MSVPDLLVHEYFDLVLMNSVGFSYWNSHMCDPISPSMTSERVGVEFPMWRKKVDGSMFEYKMTNIPGWVQDSFAIREVFTAKSQKDSSSNVEIIFVDQNRKNHSFVGHVTNTQNTRRNGVMRLILPNELVSVLRETFMMSHMRDLERRMRKPKPKIDEIEKEFPFYEFIDIEWDQGNHRFVLTPQFVMPPQYQELFSYLQNKHILSQIEDDLAKGPKVSISKGDWIERSKINTEVQTENVIYTLIDSVNKELYIGEAQNLAKRNSGERPEIPNWTHYRVDVLPREFTKEMRLQIERLMIRAMASLISNSQGIKSQQISDYTLKNKRIDS